MLRKWTKEYYKEKFNPKTRFGSKLFYDLIYGRTNRPFHDKGYYVMSKGKIYELEEKFEYLTKNEVIEKYSVNKFNSLSSHNIHRYYGFSLYGKSCRVRPGEDSEVTLLQNYSYVINNGKIILTYDYDGRKVSISVKINKIKPEYDGNILHSYTRDQMSKWDLEYFLWMGCTKKTFPAEKLWKMVDTDELVENYGFHSWNDFKSKAKYISWKLDENTLKFVDSNLENIVEYPLSLWKKKIAPSKNLTDYMKIFKIDMVEDKEYLWKDLNDNMNDISVKMISTDLKRTTPPKWYRKHKNRSFKRNEKALLNINKNNADDIVLPIQKRNASNYW